MNDPRIVPVIEDILTRHDAHKADVARGLLFNDQVPFIAEYVENTLSPSHEGYKVQVEAVYDIERNGEFKGPITNHKLLFHGTPKENVYFMLRDGYKKAIQSEHAVFGKGIYFTNCASKALNLTNPQAKESPENADSGELQPPSGSQYLFLAQVALGKSKEFSKHEKTAAKLLQDCTSVYGKGCLRPVDRCEIPESPALEVPMGQLQKDPSTTSAFEHDEYVVYNSYQCKHRYLVKVNITLNDKPSENKIEEGA